MMFFPDVMLPRGRTLVKDRFRPRASGHAASLTAPPRRGMSPAMTLIYKIFRADEWQALERDGETAGAPVDLADGYIHFSTRGTFHRKKT